MGNTNCDYCDNTMLVSKQNCLSSVNITQDLQELIREFRQRHVSKSSQRKIQSEKIIPESTKDFECDGYKQIINGGNIFLGMIRNNRPEGEGLLIKNSNDYYVGNFQKGKPHKKGYMKTKDFQFDGFFCNGSFDHGFLKNKNFTYKGSFSNNKFEGLGSLNFGSGDSYHGSFKAGKFHGNGQYHSNNGKYAGMFRKGEYCGLGIYEWKDGSIYDGEYNNGKKNGLGRFIKGDYCFEGIWKNGKPSNKQQFGCLQQKMQEIPTNY